ncbi:hypothetical protein [Serpens gallinarum]|uniref:Abi-like protein n=1 Tax=Serpens gallinarum TaxID=2763075 RepID=A0ABR8TTC1_9PSED|nr:hypothetical protein [Serpens gallinarum]MBD7979011.1 hypothetical protein [Serpens gallinarum]
MTLLQSCLIDVLKPEEGIFPYYESFLSRYSLITVTAIVSQCSLLPGTYEGMTKEHMDGDIDGMIQGLPAGSEKKRKAYRAFCLGAHIAPGESVQENENRTFASELFTQDAKKYSLSNREMILRGLNSSAFINYFFLIEDSLKNFYIDLVNPRNKFIKGSETIEVCLGKSISEADIVQEFEKELYARSKIFFDIRSLEIMWNLLNLIRNQMAHTNGFYDDKAKRSLNRRIESLAQHYSGNDDCLLSINMILDVFENHEAQVKKTGYLVIDDSLENIIRNISIFIMESLYACNRDKIANKALKSDS